MALSLSSSEGSEDGDTCCPQTPRGQVSQPTGHWGQEDFLWGAWPVHPYPSQLSHAPWVQGLSLRTRGWGDCLL